MASKFIFNLASLKKLRNHRVGIAKKEYMRLQQNLFRMEDEIVQLKTQRRQTLGDITENLAEISTVKSMSFLIDAISGKIKDLEGRIADLAPDVERHRRWMVEASRDLRAIEVLEEKRKKEFDLEEDKKEKRRADQWASESYARKMSSGEIEQRGDAE